MPIVDCGSMSGLIQRTLNRVDPRLVDHGRRVAYLVSRMLETEGKSTPKERQEISMLALLHDIGAYKTEEIDQMVEFETNNIWGHSVYGYLFLNYLSPLKHIAPAVLFHHLNFNCMEGVVAPEYRRLAQLLHLADRVDILFEQKGGNKTMVLQALRASSGIRFDPEVVALFEQADLRFHFSEQLKADSQAFNVAGELHLTGEEIDGYLKMIVFTIDFRSWYTVTHTMTTMIISREVARLSGLPEGDMEHIVYGALLHDLGKIGIPFEILEFPGKLSPQAMQIMRTHVDITEEILDGYVDEVTKRIASRHHEKLNGFGYPRGLSAKDLTKPERIVAVADIVSALCGTRSYKTAFPKEKTIEIIVGMDRNGLIDHDTVSVLVEHFDEIMAVVFEETVPVIQTYEKIQREYPRLNDDYLNLAFPLK